MTRSPAHWPPSHGVFLCATAQSSPSRLPHPLPAPQFNPSQAGAAPREEGQRCLPRAPTLPGALRGGQGNRDSARGWGQDGSPELIGVKEAA